MAASDGPPPTARSHALAVPLPAQGHLHPLMRLCETLTSAPHDAFSIAFLNIDAIHNRLTQLHQQQDQHREQNDGRSSESDVDTTSNPSGLHSVRQVCAPVPGITFESLFQGTIQHTIPALEKLVPSIEQLLHEFKQGGAPVSCLISDFCMTGPTQKAADFVGNPRIALCASSASFLLFFDYVLEGIMPIDEVLEVLNNKKIAETEVLKSGLPGLPSITKGDLVKTPLLEGHPDDENPYIYNFTSKNLRITKEKARCILVNSFEELEPEAFAALRERLKVPVYAVGPLRGSSSASLWKEDEECLQWLDEQPRRSVIYISSGSLTSDLPAQLDEMCAALLASGQRFLWVFRTEGAMYRDTGTSKAAYREEFLLAQTRGQGRVVEWAPQVRVLSHPAVAAFISHCGWNSTLEAVANGVPLLCLPLFYDQFLDAKLAVEVWKTGLRLTTRGTDRVVDREELQRVFHRLTEGEEGKALRGNATRLQELSQLALLPGGSTYNNIQSFIHTVSLSPSGHV